MTRAGVNIDSIDHIVLTVADVEATCAFYARVLGMQVVTFGAGRRALAFGSQKINLHAVGAELEPRAPHAMPGTGDLCLVTGTPMPQVLAHLAACGVKVLQGPVPRTGARGPILSVYFRDPDDNLVEVSNYPAAGT